MIMILSKLIAILSIVFFALCSGLTVNSGGFNRFRYPFSSSGYFSNNRYPFSEYQGYYPQGCPVCDSSVFSYCSHRLAHDTCCCTGDYYSGNSFECEYADCNFLHANSCKESQLIETCCCEDPYKSYNPMFSRFFIRK